jgi:hypothetical protein
MLFANVYSHWPAPMYSTFASLFAEPWAEALMRCGLQVKYEQVNACSKRVLIGNLKNWFKQFVTSQYHCWSFVQMSPIAWLLSFPKPWHLNQRHCWLADCINTQRIRNASGFDLNHWVLVVLVVQLERYNLVLPTSCYPVELSRCDDSLSCFWKPSFLGMFLVLWASL